MHAPRACLRTQDESISLFKLHSNDATAEMAKKDKLKKQNARDARAAARARVAAFNDDSGNLIDFDAEADGPQPDRPPESEASSEGLASPPLGAPGGDTGGDG